MATSNPSRRAVLGGLTAVTLIGAAAPASASRRTPPRVLSATPNAALTEHFDRYGDSGVGWTGADGAYSATLPVGTGIGLWSYSDTFLGPVNQDGSRPRTTPFLNNSFVLRDGDQLRTVHGGSTEQPTGVVVPSTEGNWYWVGANLVDGSVFQLVCLEFRRTGSGMFDFAWERNALARFTVSGTGIADTSLDLLDITALPSDTGVAWGVWVRADNAHTYVYGVEDLQQDKYLRVARVRGTDLREPWEYYTGTGWSTNETDATRVLHGIGNEFSVTTYGEWYVLITQDTRAPFSADIVAYFASTPVGPFAHETLVYRTPETGGNIITYSAHDHPELRTGNRLLVTYCVNSLVSDGLYADVDIYRPRYIDVVLGS